jgi:clorobiocin biosynthesis protein CloN7
MAACSRGWSNRDRRLHGRDVRPAGLSRSTLSGPPEDVEVEVQADDAHRLLSAISDEPAYGFGNSGGATTGLALVAQHPEQVRALVAHEPPLTELLPDRAAHRAVHEDLYQTFRGDGPGPANQKYLVYAGLDKPPRGTDTGPPRPPDPETAAALARIQDNLDLFFAHMLRPITRYVPAAASLEDASSRIVAAAGAESAGQIANRTAIALADLLDTAIVDFPGGHAGFLRQPNEFTRTLQRLFACGHLPEKVGLLDQTDKPNEGRILLLIVIALPELPLQGLGPMG